MMTSANPLNRHFWFGNIDTRPLALYRIFFAAILLKDAIYHLFIAHWFYSDQGIFPRAIILDDLWWRVRFSLMDAIGADWLASLFFGVWIIVLLLLLVGYRARLMAILNFIILLSIHDRNIYILTGADNALRLFGFWLMFIPIAQHYSVDALRRRWGQYRQSGDPADLRPGTTRYGFAFPVRMLQIQIALIYLTTGALKWIGPLWRDGSAMHYVMQLDTMMLPTGLLFREWAPPELLVLITHYTTLIELAFPILIFFPLLQPRLKMLALLGGTLLHGGIAVLMAIPDFSIVMISSYLVFVEGSWLDRVVRPFRRTREPLVIPAPLDLNSPLWFAALLLPPDRLLLSEDDARTPTGADQFSVRQGDAILSGQEAWQALASPLWGGVVSWRFVRHRLWQVGGALLERWNEIPLRHFSTKDPHHWVRYVQAGGMYAIITVVIVWNVHVFSTYADDYTDMTEITIPAPVRDFVFYTGLWQYWDLFAPLPVQIDGRMVVEGRFENGLRVNLRTQQPIAIPMEPILWGPDMRWTKLEEVLFNSQYDAVLREWGGYYCRYYNVQRNAVVGTRLAALQIRYEYVRFSAPGEPPNEPISELLWTHWCFEEYRTLFDDEP